MGPIGPNWANVPQFGKTVFQKITNNSEMSTFEIKTKVVRAEILHILVPRPSRGDPHLTVSRTFEFLPNWLSLSVLSYSI